MTPTSSPLVVDGPAHVLHYSLRLRPPSRILGVVVMLRLSNSRRPALQRRQERTCRVVAISHLAVEDAVALMPTSRRN
eukprot:CAMPEP_0172544572 /NCGR_PEP_ID=MMETSP1067-20121228/14698_1 /TAXON_ID=265564 ORGANISM="Thalassiosira punctigera, Strain Tpunct2005C2" /NCGR_SAMPLE_ID=MMETSP1067 /ASSEMBLY_ACC=CAM_ASM_000444 /LENGTH=77 /DNA_ID=CAMNT_0013331155 /DNA_START=32 /DNA_END=262 /DNA_ORIENTATION=-